MSYCNWPNMTALDRVYHDTEWGVPVHDDNIQFEYISLEVLQCGLSWSLMLKKREIFRQCFEGFLVEKVAAYTEADVKRIMKTPGMIRSEGKIRAIIGNARCVQIIQEEFGSFSNYLWGYSDGKTLLYESHGNGAVPASNQLSEKISKDLKKRGFKYMGAVTVYSHLQACGIINDHAKDCPCFRNILKNQPCLEIKESCT